VNLAHTAHAKRAKSQPFAIHMKDSIAKAGGDPVFASAALAVFMPSLRLTTARDTSESGPGVAFLLSGHALSPYHHR
jgi:hypothetical protein